MVFNLLPATPNINNVSSPLLLECAVVRPSTVSLPSLLHPLDDNKPSVDPVSSSYTAAIAPVFDLVPVYLATIYKIILFSSTSICSISLSISSVIFSLSLYPSIPSPYK